MIGAVIGDIVGSRYEFKPIKTTEFELFTDDNRFTDDTVMTAAIMKGYIDSLSSEDDITVICIANAMKILGRRYIDSGFGESFYRWLMTDTLNSYKSYGNGSAMRITAAGYVGKDMNETHRFTKRVTLITHDHEESIKAAEAVASAIYMARSGYDKKEIENYITDNYYYFMKSIDLDKIRPYYNFHVESQFSIPEALRCFFDANSFEEAIRLAVSLGGDADTQAAIAGSIAGQYFGIPQEIQDKACEYLDDFLLKIITDFEEEYIVKWRH